MLRAHIKGARAKAKRGRPSRERRELKRRWARLAAKARWTTEVRIKRNAMWWARLGLAAARQQREDGVDKARSTRADADGSKAHNKIMKKCEDERKSYTAM